MKQKQNARISQHNVSFIRVANQQFSVDSWTTVLSSPTLGLSPIPKQGSSLAMASLNFGWDTAYTMGLMQLAVFAKQEIIIK